jgi:hypothetical protein
MVHVVGNSTGDSILSSNGVLGQAKADERRGKTYCETLGEVGLIYSENVYYLAVGRKSGTGCPKSNWAISGILPYNVPLRFGIFSVYLFEYLGNSKFLSSLSPYSKVQLNIELRAGT